MLFRSRCQDDIDLCRTGHIFLQHITKLKIGNWQRVTNKNDIPPTNHNDNFVNTFTRSLFAANAQNSLSPELLANIFFLLEIYNLKE